MDLYVDKINTNLDNREITPSNEMAAPLNSYNNNNINTPEYNNIHNNINSYNNDKIENITLYFNNNSDCWSPKRVIVMNNINKFTFVKSGYCALYFTIIITILFSLGWIISIIIFADFGALFFISIVVGLIPPIFPIILGFFVNCEIILSLENDSLTITKKRIFRDINTIYKKEECERIEMEYKYDSSSESALYFSLILKTEEKIPISSIYSYNQNIGEKGINYMLNIINYKIKNIY